MTLPQCLTFCFEHSKGKNMNLFFLYIARFSFTEFLIKKIDNGKICEKTKIVCEKTKAIMCRMS